MNNFELRHFIRQHNPFVQALQSALVITAEPKHGTCLMVEFMIGTGNASNGFLITSRPLIDWTSSSAIPISFYSTCLLQLLSLKGGISVTILVSGLKHGADLPGLSRPMNLATPHLPDSPVTKEPGGFCDWNF